MHISLEGRDAAKWSAESNATGEISHGVGGAHVPPLERVGAEVRRRERHTCGHEKQCFVWGVRGASARGHLRRCMFSWGVKKKKKQAGNDQVGVLKSVMHKRTRLCAKE